MFFLWAGGGPGGGGGGWGRGEWGLGPKINDTCWGGVLIMGLFWRPLIFGKLPLSTSKEKHSSDAGIPKSRESSVSLGA